eukprot:7367124-Alexandrium_andersonii.AAC.2
MAAAQPAAMGQRGEDLTPQTTPTPGRREAGSPPERGKERRRAAVRLSAAIASGGEVREGYRTRETAYAFH